MPSYPKFHAQLRDKLLDPMARQAAQPGYAMVVSFNPYTNTCDIVTSQPGSDEMGEVLTNVPAPLQDGVQASAPKPGTMCWIAFRDGTRGDPFISHYFDANFQKFNYQKQYNAKMDTPRYLISM